MKIRAAWLACSLSVFLSLSACSLPVKFKTQGSRFDVPESTGGLGHFAVMGSVQGDQDVVLTQNGHTLPPNTHSVDVEYLPYDLKPSASIGVIRWLDFSMKNGVWDSSSLLQLKAQFLGNPLNESEEGDFSAAIAIGGGLSSHKETETESDWPFSSATETDQIELKTRTGDLGLSAGYRVGPRFLVYGGPFYSHTRYSGRAEGGKDYAPVTFEGESQQWGGTAGVHYGFLAAGKEPGVFMRLELGYLHLKTGDTLYDGGLFGGQFGLNF